MEYNKPRKITLKNTRLIFRPNFKGEVDRFGSTDRQFNIVLKEEPGNTYGTTPSDSKPLKIEDLINDGWNVRHTEATDEYESTAFLRVKVAFRKRDGSEVKRKPTIIKAIGGPDYKVTLDEESVGSLDSDYIENIDHIDIRGWEYEEGKISAYLVNMFVTVEDDPFMREFGDFRNTEPVIEGDDEMPW